MKYFQGWGRQQQQQQQLQEQQQQQQQQTTREIAQRRFNILRQKRLNSESRPGDQQVGGRVHTRHQRFVSTTRERIRKKAATAENLSDEDEEEREKEVEAEAEAEAEEEEEEQREEVISRIVTDNTDRLQVQILKTKEVQQSFMQGQIRRKRIHLAICKPTSETDSQLSILEMMLSFQTALTKLFDETLQDVHEDDLVQVILRAPSMMHHISTKYIKRSAFSVEFVLAVIQDRAQSNFDLTIGEGVHVDVMIIKTNFQEETLGGCRRIRANERKNPRPNIVRINNPNDVMCCARAIAVCIGSIIEKRSTGYTPQPLLDLWKTLTQYNGRVKGRLGFVQKHYSYDQIKKGDESGRQSQRVVARRLCDIAGVDPQKPCGISEIKKFEDKLEVSIKIVDAQAFNTFSYHGRRSGQSLVNLYLLKEKSADTSTPCSFHYDAIVDIKQFFRAVHFCHVCNEGFTFKNMHKCADVSNFCTACYERSCFENRTFFAMCDICLKPFRSMECKLRHEMLKDEICVQIFCPKCHWRGKREFIHKLRRYETKIEVLSKRHPDCLVTCNVCKRIGVKEDHECYMQKMAFKKHVNKVVYLDFESRQEEGEHVPIFCYLKWKFDNPDGSLREQGCEEIGIGENIQNQVGDFLFAPKFRDSVIVAHNMRAYDGCFLLRYVIENGYKPCSVILNGMKMMTWVIPKFNIRIVDSLNFLPMTLADMPEAFDLSVDNFKKGFFPHFFSSKSTLSYTGVYPPPSDYGYDSMSAEKQEEFNAWYSQCQEEGKIFDFQEELKIYCRQDVEILFHGFEHFRTLVKELTSELLLEEQPPQITIENNVTSHKILNDDSRRRQREVLENKLPHHCDRMPSEEDLNRKCDPLSYLTLASLCHAIFKRCFIQENTIATVPPGGYRNHCYSKKQVEFLEYLRKTDYPDLKHVLNRGSGECGLGSLRFDGYDANSRTVVEFYGCYYHGCLKCIKNPDNISPTAKITYRSLNQQTLEREKLLLQNGFKVVFVWECEWEDFKKANVQHDSVLNTVVEEMKNFLPIDPRDSYKGGRTETYKLLSIDEDLEYVDVNSLYPFVLFSKYFPVGHPQILLNPPGVDVSEYFGFVRCSLIPPKSLYHPVLPISSNGKLLFPLCGKCGVDRSTDPCQHSDDQRTITGTWFTEEIKLAVEKGYRVTKIYQVMHFLQRSKDLFRGYVQTFYKLKLIASGLPKSLKSDEEIMGFLQEVYEKNGFYLTREDFSNPSKARRWLTKIMLNSFYGRFGMREDRKKAEFVCSNHDLSKLLQDTHVEITSIIPQTESVCMVEYKNISRDCIEMSNNTNIYIASITTAYARMELYKYLDLCSTHDGTKSRAIYCDTDSIIYKRSCVPEENLPEGLHLGDLTNELESNDNIVYFYSGGPKNYCYQTKNGLECVKVRGFSLKGKYRKVFTAENMNSLLQNHLFKNVDDNGRICLPSRKERNKEDALHRAEMMNIHRETQEDAIFSSEIGMSCLNKQKICRTKEWRLINKPEQKINTVLYDKRVSLMTGETFPYGYVEDEQI